jgi:hypothetical protein
LQLFFIITFINCKFFGKKIVIFLLMELSRLNILTLKFLASWIFFLSCTNFLLGQTNYGGVQYRHTKIEDNVNTTESQCVTIQFLNEPLNFEYKRVGLVEVIARPNMPEELLVDYLKREAYKLNANYIINVEREIVNRVYGSGENMQSYDYLIYKGIAVFTTDEKIVDVCCTDMGFLKRANDHERAAYDKYQEQLANSNEVRGAGLLLLLVGVIGFLLVLGNVDTDP